VSFSEDTREMLLNAQKEIVRVEIMKRPYIKLLEENNYVAYTRI